MTARYLIGDVLEVLPTLEAGSVDLILTSPPFLALRSYLPADHPLKAKEGGSQSTPGAFIDWLVDVVEALDRVLAPHGSMAIELGDTYAGSGGPSGDSLGNGLLSGSREGAMPAGVFHSGPGWPAIKSLTLIPELFRLTLVYGFNPLTGRQTKRWRLRNVVRWVRPNPPVGALGDKFRPATSELMVFCRTDEAGRRRYFDLDATREAPSANTHARSTVDRFDLPSQTRDGNWSTLAQNDLANPAGAPPLDWWNIPPGGYQGAHYAVFPEALCVRPIKAMCPERVCRTCGEPSRRITAVSYEPHGPRRDEPKAVRGARHGVAEDHALGASGEHAQSMINGRATKNVNTLGWSDCSHPCQTCGGSGEGHKSRFYETTGRSTDNVFVKCPACNGSGLSDNYRPGLILDPFAGSGTTLAVAVGHGRDAIGIDLDSRNVALARGRIGLFLDEVVDAGTETDRSDHPLLAEGGAAQ